MNKKSESSLPRNVTRRESLLAVLGSAMILGGCGGGSGGADAGPGIPVATGGPESPIGTPGSGVPASPSPSPGSGTEPGPGQGTTPITLANNKIVIFGDSRTSNATQYTSTTATNRVTADSYIGYAMIASNFRGEFTGNYGVNADALEQMLDRLGLVAQTRGQLLSTDPGKFAAIVIFLGGVNNSVSPVSSTGPLYQAIFQKLADAGKTVIVCNEIPSNTSGTASAEHVNRRAYLDSVTLANNNGRLIRINTFDAMLQPGTVNTSRGGYYGVGPTDTLHPGPAGNRVLGEIIGAELEKILSGAGYPSRSTKVPTLASQSVLPYALLLGTNGTISAEAQGPGGANKNGLGGAGVTGPVADGWTFARGDSLSALLNAVQPVAGSNLSVTLSKGTDSDGFATQLIKVVGQVGALNVVYNLFLTNVNYVNAANMVAGSSNGIGLTDGDRVYGAARIKVTAAAKGLLGPGLEVMVSAPSAPDTGQAMLSGTICASDRDWRATAAFDKLVLSQPRLLPSGIAAAAETKTIQQQLVISVAGGVPVDFTVSVSRFGIIKTP
jgi:lysophospholipase L1-like esterase